MTKDEWVSIGMKNGLITSAEDNSMVFYDAYISWFRSRCNVCRQSTVDRIEVTFNRYFKDSEFVAKNISAISEWDIIGFFSGIIVGCGVLSGKEFSRLYQIVYGVLNYARDMGCSGSRFYDWAMIKRNIPDNRIVAADRRETAVSYEVVDALIHNVMEKKIYYQKQSSCLCLCLNFYLGLRIGELSALKFQDFDMSRRVVSITRSDVKYYERDNNGNKKQLIYGSGACKTIKSIRIIPLVPEAVAIYEELKKHHTECGYESEYLVYDGTDCIRYRSLDRTLRKLCRLSGVQPFNTHLIRKTFATMLHHAGVPTRVISDLMGHSEMHTTERNYILSFEKKYDEYRELMRRSLMLNAEKD